MRGGDICSTIWRRRQFEYVFPQSDSRRCLLRDENQKVRLYRLPQPSDSEVAGIAERGIGTDQAKLLNNKGISPIPPSQKAIYTKKTGSFSASKLKLLNPASKCIKYPNNLKYSGILVR